MFKKCLKYDLRYVWRIWWILALSSLGISLVSGAAFRFFTYVGRSDELNGLMTLAILVCILLVIAAVFCIVAFVCVTVILSHYRFYSNFFSDEGYLTFTLPVKRQTLYLAKTLNTLIWTVASAGVVAVAVLIFLSFLETNVSNDITGIPQTISVAGLFFRSIGHGLASAWDAIGAWLLVYIVEGLVLVLLLSLFTIGFTQLCITIGAIIAKKHKLLAAIGIYYLVTMIANGVIQFGSYIFIFTMLPGFTALAATGMTSGRTGGCILVALLLLLACVVVAAIDAMLHFFTLGKLENRLNLA